MHKVKKIPFTAWPTTIARNNLGFKEFVFRNVDSATKKSVKTVLADILKLVCRCLGTGIIRNKVSREIKVEMSAVEKRQISMKVRIREKNQRTILFSKIKDVSTILNAKNRIMCLMITAILRMLRVYGKYGKRFLNEELEKFLRRNGEQLLWTRFNTNDVDNFDTDDDEGPMTEDEISVIELSDDDNSNDDTMSLFQ